MPKIDLDAHPETDRTGYPAPFDAEVAGRLHRSLTGALTDFGVRYVRLLPGAWSSQRHWHEGEDELVVMLSGRATLVEDDARTPLQAGDIATFPKNVPNGHHLINESDEECRFLAVGRQPTMDCHYSDIDLRVGVSGVYTRRDGTPY